MVLSGSELRILNFHFRFWGIFSLWRGSQLNQWNAYNESSIPINQHDNDGDDDDHDDDDDDDDGDDDDDVDEPVVG